MHLTDEMQCAVFATFMMGAKLLGVDCEEGGGGAAVIFSVHTSRKEVELCSSLSRDLQTSSPS